jgi:hypothetical protein
VIGKMGFELHHVEEAFTSEHWMVRVYRCGPGLRRWQQQQQPAAAAGWCLTAAGGRRVLPDHNRLPSHVSAARLARRKAKRVAAKELPGGSAAGKLDGDAVGPGELGAEGGTPRDVGEVDGAAPAVVGGRAHPDRRRRSKLWRQPRRGGSSSRPSTDFEE